MEFKEEDERVRSYKCNDCNHQTFHYEKWDSYFCALCNSWSEDKCDWNECAYCINRPDEPFNKEAHDVLIRTYKELSFGGVIDLMDFYFNEM